jgi:hypothetical protein
MGLSGGLFPADLAGFICDGESDGDIEGALEKALDLGDPMLSIKSPIILGGRGGYAVPGAFPDTLEKGDKGLSASPDLLMAILLAALGDWHGNVRHHSAKRYRHCTHHGIGRFGWT